VTSAQHDDELEAEGIPAIYDALNDDEGMATPRDHPIAATDYGITAEEQRRPEPLADRVRREQPDIFVGDEEPVGRLVSPDAGGGADDEPTEVAMETEDDAGESAEEAAVHIIDPP
jgi:hypothetical protein